jgi:hypothetical protein
MGAWLEALCRGRKLAASAINLSTINRAPVHLPRRLTAMPIGPRAATSHYLLDLPVIASVVRLRRLLRFARVLLHEMAELTDDARVLWTT